MMDLKGKVAIVSGSATGVGAACAIQLAAEGCNVVINYTKSVDAAEETAATCREKGVEAITVQANIASDDDCKRMVAAAVDTWGRLDILVNNAGTTKFVSHHNLDGLEAQDFQDIYGVNVIGTYQLTRAAAPAMRETGDAAVVNVSSIAGVTGIGSCIAYAASKGALNTMTMSLARVLGPEIRVNAICPGFIGTRWFRDRMDEDQYRRMEASVAAATPLQVASGPDDIAASVFYALGIDHHTEYYTRTNRPVSLVPEGRVLTDLFS